MQPSPPEVSEKKRTFVRGTKAKKWYLRQKIDFSHFLTHGKNSLIFPLRLAFALLF